jgi:hypothetical protein
MISFQSIQTTNHTCSKISSGCLKINQFRLRAFTAIQDGSARHQGTSLEKQALRHYIYTRPLTAQLLPSSLPRFHAGWCACGH